MKSFLSRSEYKYKDQLMTSACLSPESGLFKWAHCELLERGMILADDRLDLLSVGGDAGFRQYFRPRKPLGVLIVLAPRETENTDAFLEIADFLRAVGIRAPKVLAVNKAQGFLIVEDFGDRAMLDLLDEFSVDGYYGEALHVLLRLQQQDLATNFPLYTEAKLRQELGLFLDWFVEGLLKLPVDEFERKTFNKLSDALVTSALSQESVIVHRDFHSRNIMIFEADSSTTQCGIGLIDFQDAVIGPFTYDLVSLLKDCYIQWPRDKVISWLLAYASMARDAGVLKANISAEKIIRDFDLMGLQRHLKVLGIFSRLKIRDSKSSYLKDIPRVFSYVNEIADLYPEFDAFYRYLEVKVAPAYIKAQEDGVFS